MALTYDNVSAITEKKFIPRMVDNIFDSNPLLMRAKSKGWYDSVDGGTSSMVPLNYATNSAGGWYTGTDTLSTDDVEVITSAEYTWKYMYDNISVTRSDELKNSGDRGILKLVAQKVKIAEKTARDRMGTGLYSDGTTTNEIVGLRDIVAADQTVGGISQSSYSWWQGNVDSCTTTLTISAMQTQFSNARIGSDRPTVIVCTSAVFDIYYNLLQPQQRFADKDTAAGWFMNLMFNGVPVLEDSHCPSGDMYMLNENYLHLFYHKDENFRFEPFQKPVNQNVKLAKIYWAGALGSSNNRMHAVLNAITA